MNSLDFVNCVRAIKDYWLAQNKSKGETAEGICFSILTLIDGESGRNDFQQILLTTRGSKNFNKDDFLHEIYCSE